jgi:antitoxin FitA
VPVNLSVKNAPDDVVDRLRQRAARNHRSLQGELMAIIEAAVTETPQREITLDEYRARIRALGLNAVNESADIVRADRDARQQR